MAQSVRLLLLWAVALLVAGCSGSDTTVSGAEAPAQSTSRTVVLQTNLGDITLQLDAERAPLTVENFLLYAQQGHYDGTIFHRVIAGFMVQGGGFTEDFTQKATFDPVANEADNGLKNNRYTIAMARTSDPQSATSQFYINVADNNSLDYVAPTNAGWGYAVFGRVTDGFATVDQIEASATGAAGPFGGEVPLEPVIIQSVQIQ